MNLHLCQKYIYCASLHESYAPIFHRTFKNKDLLTGNVTIDETVIRERNVACSMLGINTVADKTAIAMALDTLRITSKLIWDCVSCLGGKRLQSNWVPVSCGNLGIKDAGREGSSSPFLGPELSISISLCVGR